MVGKVKWFNDDKGYGFIEMEDGKNVFVHYTSIIIPGYKTLLESQCVEFDLIITKKGLQAKNVKELQTTI